MSNILGKVISLYISQKNVKQRIEVDTVDVDSHGILLDKYYNTNPERSILITSLSSYALAQKHQILMPFGSLGENLLIDYNPYHLKKGSILQIGSTRLEISQNCTICEHLSSIDTRLPSLLQTDRGIFAKVLINGEIKKGDTIVLER